MFFSIILSLLSFLSTFFFYHRFKCRVNLCFEMFPFHCRSANVCPNLRFNFVVRYMSTDLIGFYVINIIYIVYKYRINEQFRVSIQIRFLFPTYSRYLWRCCVNFFCCLSTKTKCTFLRLFGWSYYD